MNAVVRKLTTEDIPSLNEEGVNGQHLVEYGYYKVSLVDRPDIYCYTREFGGVAPEDIGPYLRTFKSEYVGEILRIDLEAIHNDPARNPVKTISVQLVEDLPSESLKIFRDTSEEKYYMRLSSYPREKFARWMTTYKRQGRWEDGAELRANVIFEMNGETEKVTYTNWNGPAVYEKDFNEKFEKG